MKITITITHGRTGKSYDIQVSDEQRIEETLDVLKNNLPIFSDIGDAAYIREKESGRRVTTDLTYAQAHIYSGAELLIDE